MPSPWIIRIRWRKTVDGGHQGASTRQAFSTATYAATDALVLGGDFGEVHVHE